MESAKTGMNVLFIGKTGDYFSEIAAGFIQQHFANPIIVYSDRIHPFPVNLLSWKGDLVISYLSQWIIPAVVLNNASVAAINFHPGPPEYPGIGCTNFAIYDGASQFGITCHHMLAKVDTGSLIMVRRFPVFSTDSVYSVTQRCYAEILHSFYEVISSILEEKPLPSTPENWKRKPYTRKQLNELCLLAPGMDREEIKRRLKSTTYGEKIWAGVQYGDVRIPYEEALEKGVL